jgi:hypothetical protein
MPLFKKLNKNGNSDINREELILKAQSLLKEGVSEYEVKQKLIADISDNKYMAGKALDRIISGIIRCAKTNKGLPPVLHFSTEEMDFIHSLDDEESESILFILFCLYKYYGDRFSFKESVLLKEAEAPKAIEKEKKFIGLKNQDCLFYQDLKSEGIRYTASDFVKNLYNPDNECLTITYYEHIVFHYKNYFGMGGTYFPCFGCGKIQRQIISGTKKYCKECARLANIRNTKENEIKRREKLRQARENRENTRI